MSGVQRGSRPDSASARPRTSAPSASVTGSAKPCSPTTSACRPSGAMRRARLHEAALRADAGAVVDWAAFAADLGYADQAI